MRLRLLALFLALASVCGGAAAVRAQAADTLAPPGASRDWLPNETWVQQRWLPYSEVTLMRTLHTSRTQLEAWLADQRHTMSGLARHNGVDPVQAQRRLVAPWRSHVSPAAFAVLSEHAARTFSQRHLMQHMMYHPLHIRRVNQALHSVTGVPQADLGSWEGRGMSLFDIGRAHGRSKATMRRLVINALVAAARQGVRRGETSRTQARRSIARERAAVESFLSWRYARRAVASSARSAPATLLCHLD